MASSHSSAPHDSIDSESTASILGDPPFDAGGPTGLSNGMPVVTNEPPVPLASDSDKTVIRSRPNVSSQTGSGNGSASGNVSNGSASRSPRSAWQSTAESLIGQRLDHFQIESLVGIGGMGAVFRGQDQRLNREVAIKAVPILGRDPEAMRRFRFEAQSAAKLDHPNIARVYYVGETEDWSYIVFEFVEGVNLREQVLRNGPLSVDQAVYLVRQVSQALQHASDRQVVHRDIKPSNIVLTPGGQAKIVDMGLARITELDRSSNDLTASGVTLGTFDYISPEQAHDPRDADVRSDIYSLGCTLYFLLTSSPPFPEGTALQKLLLHGSKMPEDPRIYRPELSDSLIAILRKMIAKRPADRYQQPTDLIDDLQTLAAIEDLAWTRDSDPRDIVSHAPSTIWRNLAPLGVALLAILGVALWLQAKGMQNAMFSIPRVVVSEPADAPERAKPTENTNTILSVPADSGSILVDSRFTVEQLETNRQLASTLDQAIERFNLSTDADKIVLQNSVVLSTQSLKALNRNRTRLKISSQEGLRCRIDIQAKPSELEEAKAWIDCGTIAITIEKCDIHWRPGDTRQCLFLCKPGSQLSLIDSTFWVQTENGQPSASTRPSFVRCESVLQNNASAEPPSSLPSTRLQWRNIIIRGDVDVVQATSPVRVECLWSNSVMAVTGSILQLPRVNTNSRGGSSIRMDLQSITTYTPRCWIHASWASNGGTPIPVIRTARECVFGGMESFVLWDVAAAEDWKFWEQSKRGQELSRWLDLRGSDNCYDETVMKQLLEARLRNGMTEQLPMTAEAKLLAEERGLEISVPWKTIPTIDIALQSDFSLNRLQLTDTSFPRGANLSSLPRANPVP